MTLGGAQRLFARDLGLLICYAYSLGYELTVGEAYRTKEQSALNAKTGAGIGNSNHTRCLAMDLNLFIAGKYMTESEDHAELGEYWKSLDPANVWGGDFKRRDGNHYSRRYKRYPV